MGQTGWLIGALACGCAVMLAMGGGLAQGQPSEQEVVVATVGGEPVYARDVDRMLGRITQAKNINPAVLPVFQAQVLLEIVDRRLVLAYARRTKTGPGKDEVEAALARLTTRLKARGQSLDDFLRKQSVTEADLRRQIAWNLTWEKYLGKHLTEERLASHFEAHRRQFDGTEVSASHILLRPGAEDGPRAAGDLAERARAVRHEIVSGEISFADAARKHSAGPSATDGGRLGFIGRQGPMVESFSRAAFALEVGQVSEPVTTRFGVHLVRCDEIRPGKKELSEVRKQVEQALARELLEKLARIERGHTPVELTGKGPHFKPGTQELVVPPAGGQTGATR